MNFLKTKQLSRHRQLSLQSSLLSFSSHPFGLMKTFFLRAKTTKIVKRRRKSNVKTLSLRLNTRPYNRLDKEVIDFKEYKEGPVTQYNTKCSHYQNGQNKDKDEHKTYIQYQTPIERCKTIAYSQKYTQNKKKVGDRKEPRLRYKLTFYQRNKNKLI